MTLEELKVIITAETSGLKKELNSLQSQLNKTQAKVDKSTSKISNGFKKITKGISFTVITLGLYKLGKQAVETASDLQEVQNVVDVSFGSMSAEIDKFAENAIKQFGLSKLSAKQFASTFMAMSNGMGVVAEAGKNMSLNLTALSADMASFYNVEQDVAFTALKSVFTGETETLKRFGIVMTETNLEAYALSQGITKSYSEMSQAEKVALRYSFVLNATKNAQGDFARTSNNWANQTRILKEQFKELLGILGNGLLKVLQPLLVMLNKVLSSLISIANAAAKAFGGKEIKEIGADVKNTETSANGIADGYDNAEESAKKLKRTLAGFDEINKLAEPDTSSSSNNSTSGIDPSIMALGMSSYLDEESKGMIEKAEESAKSIADIFHKYFDNLPKLEIKFNKEKALENLRQIGLNVLSIIASWGSFVIEIAIKVLNDLEIGRLANDLLDLLSSVVQLAKAISDVLKPVLITLYDTFLSPIIKVIGDIAHILLSTLASAIKALANYISEHSETIATALEVIGAALIGGIAAWKLYKAAMMIGSIIKTVVTALSGFSVVAAIAAIKAGILTAAQTALNFVMSINPIMLVVIAIGALVAAFVVLWNKCEGFRNFWKGLWADIKSIFSSVWEGMKSVVLNVVNTIIGFINGMLQSISNGVNAVIDILNKIKIDIPDWIPIIGGKKFGINIEKVSWGNIPTLANGGVITSPTIAMMGEYAGASHNPEIVAPQSILQQIIASTNSELINAIFSIGNQISKSVDEKNTDIYMDTAKVTRRITKEQTAQKKQMGDSLVLI